MPRAPEKTSASLIRHEKPPTSPPTASPFHRPQRDGTHLLQLLGAAEVHGALEGGAKPSVGAQVGQTQHLSELRQPQQDGGVLQALLQPRRSTRRERFLLQLDREGREGGGAGVRSVAAEVQSGQPGKPRHQCGHREPRGVSPQHQARHLQVHRSKPGLADLQGRFVLRLGRSWVRSVSVITWDCNPWRRLIGTGAEDGSSEFRRSNCALAAHHARAIASLVLKDRLERLRVSQMAPRLTLAHLSEGPPVRGAEVPGDGLLRHG